MSNRASDELLGELHTLQAEVLLEALRAMKAGDVDEDGNTVKMVNASVLAQVNAFLKNNGVEALPEADGSALGDLADELPVFDGGGETVVPFISK